MSYTLLLGCLLPHSPLQMATEVKRIERRGGGGSEGEADGDIMPIPSMHYRLASR